MLIVSDVENPMVGPGEVRLLGAVPKPNLPFEALLHKETMVVSVLLGLETAICGWILKIKTAAAPTRSARARAVSR